MSAISATKDCHFDQQDRDGGTDRLPKEIELQMYVGRELGHNRMERTGAEPDDEMEWFRRIDSLKCKDI